MAVNETYVDAPPEAVYDVLSDPHSYAHWVVGSSQTRGVDGDWPEPGSRFHHVQGLFGIGLPDNTAVVSATRPRTIVLEARIRPFAVNKVELRLFPRGRGTRVVMIEYPIGGLAAKLDNPLLDLALYLRNLEALRRLRTMAEEGRTR
jgi:uncharacterized protein YndB with AHSA1/START domain